jgi:hypothetical protein
VIATVADSDIPAEPEGTLDGVFCKCERGGKVAQFHLAFDYGNGYEPGGQVQSRGGALFVRRVPWADLWPSVARMRRTGRDVTQSLSLADYRAPERH